MTTHLTEHDLTDAELWTQVCDGQVRAFETVVRRHQSALCAVAYSLCGDRATSEDLAQDAFWAAWQQRTTLADYNRLRPWLCGIVRNLAKNDHRSRVKHAVETLTDEIWSNAPSPSDVAVSHEEEALLWSCLEIIPETYREPLVLFYRELQSIAQVATALEISEDAAKQRLSRGRSLLRDQVASVVEGTLRRTRPGAVFTATVMSAMSTMLASSAKTAAAATVQAGSAVALKAAAGASAGAIAGSLFGAASGLLGAWFGTWLPAQLAPSQREREMMQRMGRQTMIAAVAFMIGLFAVNFLAVSTLRQSASFAMALVAVNVGLVVLYGVWITAISWRVAREQRRIRAETPAGADPNRSPIRKRAEAFAHRWRGRVYRSRWTLLGLPLVDCHVSDPSTGMQLSPADGNAPSTPPQRHTARGWIAIGDVAYGVLLAVGGRAVGGIALGGLAMGGIAFGGLAVGGVTVGGLAVGLLAIGGLGAGGLAVGGGAIGWQAIGGGAVGWDVAVGGFAWAHHAAFGGAAIAHDFAVGGGAWATNANDEAAKAVLMAHPLKQAMDWYVAHNALMTAAIILLSLLPLGLWPVFYRRVRNPNTP